MQKYTLDASKMLPPEHGRASAYETVRAIRILFRAEVVDTPMSDYFSGWPQVTVSIPEQFTLAFEHWATSCTGMKIYYGQQIPIIADKQP